MDARLRLSPRMAGPPRRTCSPLSCAERSTERCQARRRVRSYEAQQLRAPLLFPPHCAAPRMRKVGCALELEAHRAAPVRAAGRLGKQQQGSAAVRLGSRLNALADFGRPPHRARPRRPPRAPPPHTRRRQPPQQRPSPSSSSNRSRRSCSSTLTRRRSMWSRRCAPCPPGRCATPGSTAQEQRHNKGTARQARKRELPGLPDVLLLLLLLMGKGSREQKAPRWHARCSASAMGAQASSLCTHARTRRCPSRRPRRSPASASAPPPLRAATATLRSSCRCRARPPRCVPPDQPLHQPAPTPRFKHQQRG